MTAYCCPKDAPTRPRLCSVVSSPSPFGVALRRRPGAHSSQQCHHTLVTFHILSANPMPLPATELEYEKYSDGPPIGKIAFAILNINFRVYHLTICIPMLPCQSRSKTRKPSQLEQFPRVQKQEQEQETRTRSNAASPQQRTYPLRIRFPKSLSPVYRTQQVDEMKPRPQTSQGSLRPPSIIEVVYIHGVRVPIHIHAELPLYTQHVHICVQGNDRCA
ncbi:hypothetical protein F4861DRAFT_217841 [Xylaria intraflava]|nr:hypothetical protein F4861DRAFT_217841 [Xylaria intraflava]